MVGSTAYDFDVASMVGALLLIGYAAWRTVQPVTYEGTTRGLLEVLLEVALHVLVVVATGYWESPYAFSLITAIIVAGTASGFGFALRISIVSALAVAIPYHAQANIAQGEAIRETAQWSVELVLVAVVAGYARRFSGEAEARHSLALDRLGRLSQANALLYSLNQVAQSLPASLDLDETLDSTVARLRTFYEASALAILVHDETSDEWNLARQEGVRLPPVLVEKSLPAAVRQALASEGTVLYPELDVDGHAGLVVRSRSGMYAPLRSRGELIGVLAVEHTDSRHFNQSDAELLDGLTEAAALAIDNARWFARLRTVGADEERTRIARELHDRVGQSLAYLAFEIDRLIQHTDEAALRPGLDQLRQDLRGVIGEIRDTLYDLRTDVSEESGFIATVESFLQRVRSRSGADIGFDHDTDGRRLPILQEREMWRIAQEAITNAERHSGASIVRVLWSCDGIRAHLEVADNGSGFDAGKAGRTDSYGMLGMRERAAGIGAALHIDTEPGRGTRVRCSLDPR